MDIFESVVERPEDYTPDSIREALADDAWLRNRALAAWARATNSEEVFAYPLDVALPLVGYCNAKCHFCTFCRYEQFHMGLEEIDKYDALIRHCVNYGFSAYGEPLAHPDFALVAKDISSRMDERASTYLVTNGILLNKLFDAVDEHCTSISVSINAATPKNHAKRMGVSEKHFPGIIEALGGLVNSSHQGRLVSMSYVVSQDSLEEIPEIIKIANELKIWKLYLNPLCVTDDDAFKHSKNIAKEQYIQLNANLHPEYDRLRENALAAIAESEVPVESNLFDKPVETEIPETFSCSYLYERLLIMDKDLTMRICCYMESLEGEAVQYDQDTNFLEKWNSPLFKRLRKALGKGQYPPTCKRCIQTQSNLYAARLRAGRHTNQ